MASCVQKPLPTDWGKIAQCVCGGLCGACCVCVCVCLCVCASRPLSRRVLDFLGVEFQRFISEVVLTLSVGNPYDPRGGTCGPGVWRAACLFEVPACSTGWAPFGVSCFGVLKLFRIVFVCGFDLGSGGVCFRNGFESDSGGVS